MQHGDHPLDHEDVTGMVHMHHHNVMDYDHTQVPSFLTKTYEIVNDPTCDHIISWSESGQSFIIHDIPGFLSEVVPKHFKHNNLASFIRQLNIYGFQKVGNKHVCEFRHDFFHAKEPHLLTQIRRKTPSAKRMRFDDDDDGLPKTEAILTELLQLKQRQDLMEMNLVQVMNTNDSLWNDLVACKQQQRDIQENLQKTLYFLMAVHGTGEDKKMPSVLDVGGHSHHSSLPGDHAHPNA